MDCMHLPRPVQPNRRNVNFNKGLQLCGSGGFLLAAIRACQDLQLGSHDWNPEGSVWLRQVSFIEIYQDDIRDLLGDADSYLPINVRESPDRGTFLENVQ